MTDRLRRALFSSPSPLAGEGWGGGYAAVSALAILPPSRPPSLTLRRSTSPARGEVRNGEVAR